MCTNRILPLAKRQQLDGGYLAGRERFFHQCMIGGHDRRIDMSCPTGFGTFTAAVAASGVLILSACTRPPSEPAPQANAPAGNPLLSPSSLPFQAPPCDKIKDSDFAPAFDEAI